MTGHRHAICPACGAINRLPAGRPAARGRCGSCQGALFTGQPLAVDGAGFDRHVMKGDIPVLADFWAPWCGPCRQMAPQFAGAARLLEPDIRLLTVNVDEEPGLAARLGIQGIPALLLFQGGRLVARQAGLLPADRLAAWTRSQLAPVT